MDNTINNEEIETKDKPKNYKKEYLIGIFMLIAFMCLQLCFSGIYDIYADSPVFWIVFNGSWYHVSQRKIGRNICY